MTRKLVTPKIVRQQLHLRDERYIINVQRLECQRELLDLVPQHLTS